MLQKRNLLFLSLLILGVFSITGCFLIPSLTYTVTYDGNSYTGGSVPTDSNKYEQGDSMTALDQGDLVKIQDEITFLFKGWNTDADGSGTHYLVGEVFAIGSADVTLYAQWLAIGATGPAGGIVFYDKNSYSDGWRYLEAAPVSTEWMNKEWGSNETLIGGTGYGIGAG